MKKECRKCIHAYQRECIGLVMCPQWEMADGDVAETCPDYVKDDEGYIKSLFEEEEKRR